MYLHHKFSRVNYDSYAAFKLILTKYKAEVTKKLPFLGNLKAKFDFDTRPSIEQYIVGADSEDVSSSTGIHGDRMVIDATGSLLIGKFNGTEVDGYAVLVHSGQVFMSTFKNGNQNGHFRVLNFEGKILQDQYTKFDGMGSKVYEGRIESIGGDTTHCYYDTNKKY